MTALGKCLIVVGMLPVILVAMKHARLFSPGLVAAGIGIALVAAGHIW